MQITRQLGKQLDGQSLTQAFAFSREKEKAFYGLRGILTGVVADRRLNEKELLYLDAWMQSQQYLAEDADVRRMLTQVSDILEDGVATPAELAAMQSSIERFLKQSEEAAPGVGQMDELLGFLLGVASDGVLNDHEIAALTSWLDRHNAIRETWPASVVIERIANILEDGLITEEEREDLLKTLQRVTGTDSNLSDLNVEASIEVWEDEIDAITIPGATFCMTGDFISGDRNTVETMLKLKGANISPNVNKNIGYLVIGTLASRDWLYTPHGRKIEKALLLKREGAKIAIITERSLLKAMRQAIV